jgi:hypothetical protein
MRPAGNRAGPRAQPPSPPPLQECYEGPQATSVPSEPPQSPVRSASNTLRVWTPEGLYGTYDSEVGKFLLEP